MIVVGYHWERTVIMALKMGLFKLVFTKHFTCIMLFTLPTTLWGNYYYTCTFLDEATEAGEVK